MRLLRDVVDALSYAHEKGVVHRDIKPDNVMLSGRHAFVTDFGVAKALSEATGRHQITTAGVALGTPSYMSPEQAAADPNVDHRSDIYAVGALGYELLAGRPPFVGTSAQEILVAHMTAVPDPVVNHAPNISPQLDQLVMRCLEKKPEDRWPSADALLEQLELQLTPTTGLTPMAAPSATGKRRSWIAAGIGAVTIGAIGFLLWQSQQRMWARQEAPREIQALLEARSYDEAFAVSRRALALAPQDSALLAVTEGAFAVVDLSSEPSGAVVTRTRYDTPNGEWETIGRTPLRDVQIPAGWSRFRLEAEGFEPYELAATSLQGGAVRLQAIGATDRIGPVVAVPAGSILPSYWMTGLGHLPRREVPPFNLGRFEVTNRQYKAFVGAGGYSDPGLWPPITRDGRPLDHDEAVALMVDRTGRPGPSTWELGDYPSGAGDQPVRGVSWYEAAAYARFAGAKLPTIYQWMFGATSSRGDVILPLSNVGSDGPVDAGLFRGMSIFGAFDVAGNVREWTENATGSNRFIMGGSWDEPAYMFYHANHLDPMDRSEQNGFRVATYPASPETDLMAMPVEHHFRDFATEHPVSDEIFSVYRRLYDYDDVRLDPIITAVDTTEDWIRERVTFPSPQESETIVAYLFLPRNSSPPYQTVVLFPGASALIGQIQMPRGGYRNEARFVAKAGRAYLAPI